MAITRDIARTFRAPGAVLDDLARRDRREGRLLFYLMLGCALAFVAQWPRLARQAQLDPEVPFEGLMTGALFGMLFVVPLVAYALSGLIGLALRVTRRRAEGFDLRLALFWSFLAVSPLMLLQGLVEGIIGAGLQASLLGLVVFAVFVIFVVSGLRRAVASHRSENA